MNKNHFDAIVIGAGHAGLSASYYLKTLGLKHIVFERGRIAQSWRSQRWDSFMMNSANKLNTLPGDDYSGAMPEDFSSARRFVLSLEEYVLKFNLPVKEQVEVISLDKKEDQPYFTVIVNENGTVKKYIGMQVIVCSGAQNVSKLPAFARHLSVGMVQLHASEYRSASELPKGAVVVAGSGQSGCQIAEDLLDAGRKVFLSTSLVARLPRRYRGKDCLDWLLMMGFFDLKTQDVTDPGMFSMKPPQLSGTGNGTRTMSLQQIAGKGAMIVGKMNNAQDDQLYFEINAKEHVRFADEFSMKAKSMIDGFILKSQLTAPPAEEDLADMPDSDAFCATDIASLNITDHNITSIVWCTGFKCKFDYIKLPVLDNTGYPRHTNGATDIEGLYFLGLPWLRSRKSALIVGIREDAEFITDRVYKLARKMEVRYEV